MFKRVEKRRLKKAEEEELGIDEDMKEILGMHDTDSEESASEESDSDDEEDDDDDERENIAEEDAESSEGGRSVNEDEDGDEGDDDEDAEDPNVTVRQALLDSVYVVSILPEVKACVVCPGKLLKGAKMVQLHRVSNACTLLLVHSHPRG